MATTAKEDPGKDEDVTMAETSVASSPKELRNVLYARCATFPEDHVFDQNELLSFKILPENTVEQLSVHTKYLTKEGLFKLMSRDGKACWKVVKRADAAKYKTLTQDEAIVYSYIEASQREGIWSKLLRNKTNLHMTTMNRAIKSLESKNYIKSIKTVKWPNRKTFMLSRLQPSEDVTGGPFYTDGILDEEFVHQMSYWIERYIIGRSWWHPPLPEPSKRKSNSKLTQEQAEELRARDVSRRVHGRPRSEAMLPFPAAYNGYPTLAEVTRAVNASELSGVVMRESEVGQLLDILCWDGRLEKIRSGRSYKAVRRVAGEDGAVLENGLTESPCGRCPVFDICEDDGPVNARTCEYFQDWLEL